jgi:hypothetical protein
VDCERELLGHSASAKQLDRPIRAEHLATTEGGNIVRTGVQHVFEQIKIEGLKVNTARMRESAQLWLADNECNLTTFKAMLATLTRA